MSDFETVWSFWTTNFRVELRVYPEQDDPADHFENPEDIEDIRSGRVDWFVAEVVVTTQQGAILGADALGGCAYATVREFYTAHRDTNPNNRNTLGMKAGRVVICHYFPSMVREAVSKARKELERIRVLPIKTAALLSKPANRNNRHDAPHPSSHRHPQPCPTEMCAGSSFANPLRSNRQVSRTPLGSSQNADLSEMQRLRLLRDPHVGWGLLQSRVKVRNPLRLGAWSGPELA